MGKENKNLDKILFLFTDSYPCKNSGFEYVFLNHEILALSKVFSKVYIFPRNYNLDTFSLPDNVECDRLYPLFFNNKLLRALFLLRAIFTSSFWSEAVKQLKYGLKGSLRILLWLSTAKHIQSTLDRYRKTLENNNVTLYSYWCFDVTLGLVRYKRSLEKAIVISRAHGYDLYDKDYSPYFHPFREEVLKNLDYLALISQNGSNYIEDKFPKVEVYKKVHHLGVSDPLKQISFHPKSLILVSCSTVISIKRIPLMMNSIIKYAELNHKKSIKWIHIGDGPEFEQLKSHIAICTIPQNLEIDLKGRVENNKVRAIYLSENPSFFINVSSTEGIPVSIMEALSCGIPILATDVGGVKEIVNEENGHLLPANPKIEDVVKGLEYLTGKDWANLSSNAHLSWKETWNAEVNFQEFADEIIKISRRVC